MKFALISGIITFFVDIGFSIYDRIKERKTPKKEKHQKIAARKTARNRRRVEKKLVKERKKALRR